MQLLVVQFNCLLLLPPSQHPVPEPPHPMFSQCDEPNFTRVHNNRNSYSLHLLISTFVDAEVKIKRL